MDWWRLIVLLNCVSGALSVHIELYRERNFTDLLWHGNLTTVCYNLPQDARGKSYSSITDTCVIVYWPSNCVLGWSWKIMPGKHNDFPVIAGSMRLCDDEEGGPQLNIDITTSLSDAFFEEKNPNILERNDDVCDCINVPQYVQNMSEWSIDNHHNQLFAYFEPNCKEEHSKALFIHAGHSAMSWFIYKHENNSGGINRKIQSFSPDPNAPYFEQSCSIMAMEHFELSNVTSWLNPSFEDFRKTKMGSRPRVQFFEEPNFEELLLESQSTDTCTNLPKPTETKFFVTDKILSIKTDTCVVVYSKEDCKGRNFKLQPPGSNNLTKDWETTVTGPITLGSIYTKYLNWKWSTKSFSFCTKPESHPHVDVTEYQSDSEEETLEVLQQYRDICTCQNIPKHVRRMDKWSINNFGSSLVAYFAHECESEVSNPLWIPAGQSSFSMGLGSFRHQDNSTTGIVRKILSIGPDPAASYFKNNCIQLFSTIIKFEIDEPTNSNSNERNDEMVASKTTFRNDSPSQLTQTYSASKTVRQSIQVDVGKSFSKMNSVHVDESVDIEIRRHEGSSESKSNYFKEDGFKQSLRNAYEKSGTLSSSGSKSSTTENTKSFDVTQQIIVPPCTELHVNASVKVVTNKLVEYRVIAKISGHLGDRDMTSNEVRQYMSRELDYIGDFDEHTVMAYATETFTTEYGVSSYINSKGSRIESCYQQLNGCPVIPTCTNE